MRLRRFLQRWRHDRDLDEEMRSHVDHAIQYYVDRGLTPDQARRQARLRFGNPRAHREGVHDMYQLPLLDVVARDVRYAFRAIRKTPAFSVTVCLTLAVTVGAAGAVFSLADAILLKPLPLPDAHRLAVLSFKRVSPTGEYTGPSVDGAMWRAAHEHAPSIDTAVSFRGAQGVNFVAGDTPSFVRNQVVGSGYFRVLGVFPHLGREFLPEEAKAGGPAVVMLSHAFWQRALAGRADVLDQTILLRGEPFTVVGVMPAGFKGLIDADVWTPMTTVGQGLNYMVVARPKDGVTFDTANAQLAALGDEPFTMLRPPAEGVTRTLVLQGLQDTLVADAREPILMLAWAVGAVLLIACVNITALLLARGGTRVKEIATRMALGSGRAAVIRQLMVESLALAAIGGALGLLAAVGGLEGLKAIGDTTYADWQRATLDWRGVTASFALAGCMSILFGLLPAWQTSRIDVQRALTDGGSRSIAGGSRHLFRRLLVVVEVALGVVVLVAAGLLVRQFVVLRSLDPGFTPDRLYTASASLQDARYRDPATVNQLFSTSVDRLRRMPGIQAAAVSQGLPYERLLNLAFSVDGRPDDEKQPPITNAGYVTAGFFETFGVDITAGRAFDERDRAGSPLVVVVNESFARYYFPGEAAVGRRLRFGKVSLEIVGVSRDVQQARAGFFLTGMQRGPVATSPTMYIPAAQTEADLFRWFSPTWTVRAGSSGEAAAALGRAIGESDPLLPIGNVRAMTDVVASSMAQPRLLMTLVGSLALTALFLTALGIHGLITHAVAERTREFGIRLALGATPGQTVMAVARSGIGLAIVGAVIGVALSFPGTKAVESFLYTVQPTDPGTYFIVGAALIAVATLSSVVPALRILRLDPARTLRD